MPPDSEQSGRLLFCLKLFPYTLTSERCMCKINIFPIVISRQAVHSLTLKESQSVAPVWCDTLCGSDWFLRLGNTYCQDLVLSFNSVCQCGAFLVRQYISFWVVVSVTVKALIDKIVVGKCCLTWHLIIFDSRCCSRIYCHRTSKLSCASCTSCACGQDSPTFSVSGGGIKMINLNRSHIV